ncbi:MAG: hypothetical protein OQK61_02100 [Ignavibacteriaceae bacterium]|nr:hypothetical protein [Ignavibacteriaceae bacterium]
MHTNDHIKTEVRETLALLDTLPELEPHYLFRARLFERIEHETAGAFHERHTTAGGLKFAFMAFLFVINIGSVFVLMQSNTNEQMLSKQEVIQSLTNEYNSPALSYYFDNDSVEDKND